MKTILSETLLLRVIVVPIYILALLSSLPGQGLDCAQLYLKQSSEGVLAIYLPFSGT